MTILVFGLFALTLAARDVAYRVLLAHDIPLGAVLLGSGLLSLLAAPLLHWNHTGSWRLQRPGLQTARLCVNAGFWILAVLTFRYLRPSTVNILAKIALPILVIVGPRIGHPYTTRERRIAVLAVLLTVLFAWVSLAQGASAYGLLLLGIAIGLSILEYLLLANAVKKEPPIYVVATPALACTLAGLALVVPSILSGGNAASVVPHTPTDWGWLLLAGICFFGAYWTSIVRYRLLPPGLAEYPALLPYFLLLPIEWLLFGHTTTPLVFTNAVVTLGLMTMLLALRRRTACNAPAATKVASYPEAAT